MATGTRWIVGLVLTVMALSAVAAGPVPVDTAGTRLPDGGQLSPGPATPAAPPPMSTAVEVSTSGSDNREPDVAYSTQYDEYLVVWEGNKTIWGRRVSSRGQTIGQPFPIETGATFGYMGPRIAYDSSRNRYLVVWGRLGSFSAVTLHGRFIPALGPTAALTAFAIEPSPLADNAVYSLAYALAQDEFFVVWNRTAGSGFRQGTFGRRIEADGSGFPASTFPITEHATDNRRHPDVAYNLQRNEYLVTVDDGPKVNENVYGTRLTAGGVVLGGGEFGIADGPDDELGAAVAACPTGDQYLAAWHSIQVQAKTDGIYAAFVSGDGSPGSGVQLAHYGYHQWPRPIDAACGVTNQLRDAPRYLVAWAKAEVGSPPSCLAREVFPTGTMRDPVAIAGSCGDVAVAGGAMNHLVVFEYYGIIKARIVGNTRPVATFSVTPQEGDSTTAFQFDAGGCSDATDDPAYLQVRWDWTNDGVYDTTWSTTKTASHQFPLGHRQPMAVFSVRLEVTDGNGATDRTIREVKVNNAPPSALLTVQPASGGTGTRFKFDASGSSDPEGGALQVRWDWRDDGNYDTAWGADWQPEQMFHTPGSYTVRAQVKDSWDQADSQTCRVTVGQAGNAPPTAAFSVTPSSGDTATLFAFDASASTDAEDGAPSAYRWDWQDDGTFDIAWSASPAASHTFPIAGTYTVRLEVRDSGLLTGTATRTVLVAQPGALQQTYLPLVTRRFP